MEEVAIDAAVEMALHSVLNDRLTILAGAGLSMAHPTLLPSAPEIAARAKAAYLAAYGPATPIPDDIENQAEYFFARGELATVFFRSLVNKHLFSGPPNSGHLAVADLLLVNGIKTAVTTNVDTAIEAAGAQLYGRIAVSLDGDAAAVLHPDDAPMLKIHGCQALDPDNMIWAPGQLGSSPVKERIDASARWLRTRLSDRDLLIVGYWTDWDYLNDVLESVLGQVRPARVFVIDPAEGAAFEEKAPQLYRLGQRAQSGFKHVRVSGDVFLDALRREFSRSYVRRLLHSGIEVFEETTGNPPTADLLEPPVVESEMLWRLRRDMEGRKSNEHCRARAPQDEPFLALTLLQIRAKGGVFEGPFWKLDGKTVRVVRTTSQPLHHAKSNLGRGMAPSVSPDFVIAVGAEASVLPGNIARSDSGSTITRADVGKWLTRQEAQEELQL